jgi:hypothetical protein
VTNYEATGPDGALAPGDRMFIGCEGGGPSLSRLERFPPRPEIEDRGGMYVLVDHGPPADWKYVFVPNG